MKGDGSLLAEKEEEEEAKRSQKKVTASAKPEAIPVPMKPATKVTVAGTRVKRCRKGAREATEAQQNDNFLRNEPSPSAVTRDVIGTISRGVTPRDTRKVITKLLSNRWHQGGGRELVAARASPGGGGKRVACQDIATLRPTKWIHK